MTKRKKRSPNENELMIMLIMSKLGMSLYAIAKEMGFDPHTVKKYTKEDLSHYTPFMLQIVEGVVDSYLYGKNVCVSEDDTRLLHYLGKALLGKKAYKELISKH